MHNGSIAPGTGAGNSLVSAILIGAAGAVAVVALTFLRGSLYGYDGLVGAACFVALAYSPLVGRRTALRSALQAVAVVVLLGGQIFGGLAWLSQALAVGIAMGLAAARLVPYEAGVAVRLAVGLGSTLSFLALALALGVGVDRLTSDGSMVGRSLVLGILALVGMQASLFVALRISRNEARARAATAAVQPPQGWFWGKLHHRALGRRALGYRYIDPTAGASFHVVGDLAAPPTADELRRAGYRGDTTVRLGGHVTMYPRDGASEDESRHLQQEFEEGGPVGVVVLALAPDERRALGLPDAPPWISSYLA